MSGGKRSEGMVECEIWDSHVGDFEIYCLMAFNTLMSGWLLSSVRMDLLSVS